MKNFEELKNEIKLNKGLKLAQRNRAVKLIEIYGPFVKKEEDEKEVINLVNEFIKSTDGLDKYKVRNVFISIVTSQEPSDEIIKICKSEKRGGGVQLIERAYWGRKRIFQTSEFIDKCNKKILRVKKVKK